MYNNKKQEESVAIWRFFLDRVTELLRESKGRKNKRELRGSVRALESLIRERALLPGTQSADHKSEVATQC
jgi:hypothetical protein